MSKLLSKGDRFKAIDGLRCLAVLLVVCYHMGVWGCSEMIARFVITFFFIISGYMMTMRYGATTMSVCSSVKEIVVRRIGSFLPLYWLTLIPIVLFSGFGVRWDLPFHILLMQSWITDYYYCFSYNQVAWFMSSLLVCYVCFPLLDRVFIRLSLRYSVVALIAFIITYFVIVIYLVSPSSDYVYYIFPVTRMLDFATGMVLFKLMCCLRRKSERSTAFSMTRATCVELIALAVVIAFNVLVYYVPRSFRVFLYAIIWYLPVIVLIVIFTDVRFRQGAITRFLSSRCLVSLGRLSMEIFIVHYLTLILTRKVLDAINPDVPLQLYWLVAMVVTLLAAYVAHRVITEPVKNWIASHVTYNDRQNS